MGPAARTRWIVGAFSQGGGAGSGGAGGAGAVSGFLILDCGQGVWKLRRILDCGVWGLFDRWGLSMGAGKLALAGLSILIKVPPPEFRQGLSGSGRPLCVHTSVTLDALFSISGAQVRRTA